MPNDDISVHEAGRLIAERGLTSDVRRGPTNRELSQGADDTDARYDEPPVRRRRRQDDEPDEAPRTRRRRDEDDDRDEPRNRRRDDDDLDDDEDEEPRNRRRDDDDEDEDEDDADPSNREDGEDGDDDLDDKDADDGDDRNERGERLFKVKANGKTLTVTESELIAGYSRQHDYHEKTTRLARRNVQLNAAHNTVAQEYGQRIGHYAGVVNGLKQILVGELNGAEMQALRQRDNTAWLAAREDYADRLRMADTVFQHLNQEQERHQQATKQRAASQNDAVVEYEIERIQSHIPDWAENRNGKPSGRERLANYLESVGYSKAEYQAVIDHRALLLADKARKYDQLMKKQGSRSEEPRKVAKPVPKRFKPGTSQVSGGRQAQDRREGSKFQQAVRKVKQTGDMRDAGSAIDALLERDSSREARRSRRRRR